MKINPKNLDVFCWSKIGTEAGQSLDDIIQRKEIERKSNLGIFTWGIGSALGNAVDLLIEDNSEPIVVFTPMKSKPKHIDVYPEKLFLWKKYYDKNGNVRSLPEFSLLTSKAKKNHYALLCYSKQPITKKNIGQIDSSCLVNFKTGNPVGASQVTSVVKNINLKKEPKYYGISFMAKLYSEGYVKLSSPVKIAQSDIDFLLDAEKKGNIEEWKKIVIKLKSNVSMEQKKYFKPKVIIKDLKKLGYLARQNKKDESYYLNLGGPRSEMNKKDFHGLILLNPSKGIIFWVCQKNVYYLRDLTMKKTIDDEWIRKQDTPGPNTDHRVEVNLLYSENNDSKMKCQMKKGKSIWITGIVKKINFLKGACLWDDIQIFLNKLDS